MPRYGWRKLLQEATIPYLVRLNLFALGFHTIGHTGKMAERSAAPIVVCNHQGFPDIWLFLWRCLPVGVSAMENLNFPVMGDLMLSQQTIFVDREDKDSGAKAAAKMSAIARDNRWPRLVVYPEGNTGNGRQLCAFKAGPFVPMLPVQPMVVSYARNTRFDPCWCEPAGLPVHIVALRMLLQPRNTMDITFLPVMAPSPEDAGDPARFGARVKTAMAQALGVPECEHSFTDTRLMFAARKLRVPLDLALIEGDKAARLWGVSYAAARDALERFAAGAGPKGASLDAQGLLTALRLDGHPNATPAFAARLLTTFEQGDATPGRVSYRELLAGLAPLAQTAGGDALFVERAVAELKRKHL